MTEPADMSRRAVLRGRFLAGLADALGAVVGAAADAPAQTRAAREAAARYRRTIPVHRPPGAVEEATFLRDCTRCDACLEACPHDAIVHAPPRFREAAGTPMIDAARKPCFMCADTPCIPVCEPGVLSPALPLTMGRAMIVDQTCLAHQGTTCTVCSEHCPVDGAIELTGGRPRIVEERCTGCGVCLYVCPAPVKAVIVMPLLERPSRAVPAPAPVERERPDRARADEPIVFPPMNDAILGPDEVRQLFDDLDHHAQVLDVRLKGGSRSLAGEGGCTLGEARGAIAGRTARAAQVRYRYQGDLWVDTIMVLNQGGVRLVRVRQELSC